MGSPAAQSEEISEKDMDRWIDALPRNEAYLKNLSKDFPKAWKSIAKTVERGSGLAYDEACRALVDISESYGLFTNKKQFQKQLKKFMAGHMRRKALIQRLVKAGIWEDK